MHAEAQMKQRRFETRRATVEQTEEKVWNMHQLHQALVDALKADDDDIKGAYTGRPNPEVILQQLNELRDMSKSVSCSICMENLTILDGALCRAEGHFTCNGCISDHVKEEAKKYTF